LPKLWAPCPQPSLSFLHRAAIVRLRWPSNPRHAGALRGQLGSAQYQIDHFQLADADRPAAGRSSEIDTDMPNVDWTRGLPAGININLWAGLVILAGGAVFLAGPSFGPIESRTSKTPTPTAPISSRVASRSLSRKERWGVLIRGPWLVLTTGMGSDTAVQPST
jgi:hypothetical protein